MANGKKYDKIPGDSEIKPEDRKKVDTVSDYLRKMVPTNIWEEMEERQSQFENHILMNKHYNILPYKNLNCLPQPSKRLFKII